MIKTHKISLFEALCLINKYDLPLKVRKCKLGCGYSIDCRSNTIFKVNICFMAEEETWITCDITSPILIPWYDCLVTSMYPETEEITNIWLEHESYIINNFIDNVEVITNEDIKT